MYISFQYSTSSSPPHRACLTLGFLPVVYSWLRTRRQSQPLALPADSEEEPADGAKTEIPHAPLDGWKLLLLWFPAACDLTGTTVRVPLFLVRRIFSCHSPSVLSSAYLPLPSQCAYTVNERRSALRPSFDLSDDPWRSRPLRRCPFRHLPPQTPLALPVESRPSSHLFAYIKLSIYLLDLAIVRNAHACSSDGYPLSL